MKKDDFAILVLSCDRYSDLWAPFLRQFRQFFPVDGRTIYFGSNRLPCPDPGVMPLLTGEDRDWSSSLRKILVQIQEPKIFVILEDLFFIAPLDLEGLQAAMTYLCEKDAMHVKYWANPMVLAPEPNNPRIGEYPKGAPFRATVCGFWDRKCLLDLLIDGENPWNFEILGSYRTSYTTGFYSLTRPLGTYLNMVEKGCWIPQSVEAAKRAGIELNLARRSLPAGQRRLSSQIKMRIFDLIIKIPWQWRVALMNSLRKILVSY